MDLDTIKTTAMWVIVAVGVIGIVLAIVIKKVVGKIISLVLAAVLVFFGWQQRDKVLDYANTLKGEACSTADSAMKSTSFFGINVTLPADWCNKK